MLDRIDQTIVAISSAPGFATVGIVRLSGPQAISICEPLLHLHEAKKLSEAAGSTRTKGEVEPEPGICLPCLVYLFRSPRSYTRQDIVEIHTVGAPAALEMVRKSFVQAGALPAEPGEFTARAFLNGAMEVSKAEAVASMIRARSDTQLRAARRMMDGALAQEVTKIRNELAEILALVEADIDFAEEPIEFITPPVLRDRLNCLSESLQRLLDNSQPIERFDQLPRILLLGPPNAGKSSLLNRLSGTSRAICAAAAGTTRDLLIAPIRVGRGEAILLDAAGVDDSQDEIIAQARQLTLAAARQVDLVCLVIEVTTVPTESRTVDAPTEAKPADAGSPSLAPFLDAVRSMDLPTSLITLNKIDLCEADQCAVACEVAKSWSLGSVHAVSALTGAGIEEFRAALAQLLGSDETTTLGEAVLLSERQRAALADASESLHRSDALAGTARETIDCADLLAFELREALDALGTVTGAVTTEDLLAHVFANFCIGK